jgi:hypothetical protein
MVALSLHDHTIDALLQKSEALLNENPAIDTLTLDDILALNDNHTIYNALAPGNNLAINALLDNALALDDNHAIDALLHKLEVLTLNNNYAIDTLLHKSDTHNTNNSPTHQHLCCNTTSILLQSIEIIDPWNFNYDCYELGWVLTTKTQKRAVRVESGLAMQRQ